MTSKRLLIVDDHPIFREGLKQIVSAIDNIEVIGEVDTGDAAIEYIKRSPPDIVTLDLALPGVDGLKVLEFIVGNSDATSVVIITSYDDRAYLDRAFELGATGYVLKDSATSDIVDCLAAVLEQRIFISPSLGKNTPLLPQTKESVEESLKLLTPAELNVLAMLAEFKTSKEIAKDLGISFRTVQNHRAHICSKLNLKGTHQLMSFASEAAHLL